MSIFPSQPPVLQLSWLLALALASCGSAPPSLQPAGQAGQSGPAAAAQGQARTQSKGSPMSENSDCQSDNMHRSACAIRLIIDDAIAAVGGEQNGGISGIRQLSSTSYSITIPREERATTYTYEIEFGANNAVSIKSRTESTKSY